MTPAQFRALPDAEQDEMTEFTTQVCPDCGNLRSICGDSEKVGSIYPQRHYCYFKATVELMWRRTWAKHGPPDPKSDAPHITDGLKWGASQYDLTPEDDFFGEQFRTLLGASAEQVAGDQQ